MLRFKYKILKKYLDVIFLSIFLLVAIFYGWVHFSFSSQVLDFCDEFIEFYSNLDKQDVYSLAQILKNFPRFLFGLPVLLLIHFTGSEVWNTLFGAFFIVLFYCCAKKTIGLWTNYCWRYYFSLFFVFSIMCICALFMHGRLIYIFFGLLYFYKFIICRLRNIKTSNIALFCALMGGLMATSSFVVVSIFVLLSYCKYHLLSFQFNKKSTFEASCLIGIFLLVMFLALVRYSSNINSPMFYALMDHGVGGYIVSHPFWSGVYFFVLLLVGCWFYLSRNFSSDLRCILFLLWSCIFVSTFAFSAIAMTMVPLILLFAYGCVNYRRI